MTLTWLRWLFNRRTVRTALWMMFVIILAILANVLGIYFHGSVSGWNDWMAAQSSLFLAWRLCLYAATAYGWLWLRRRQLARESDAGARRQLMRAEIASVVALVVLEASLLMQAG
ncbi:hypothetical protein [Pseudomonas sp. FME51]|uniref:hypothetical protein n=1 Tax=Pseudomonas sp. FME51 TaxID=2742609 RepID=UPI001867CA2C|nr:hypothetical protein [Pseudomonas sp. FME51]